MGLYPSTSPEEYFQKESFLEAQQKEKLNNGAIFQAGIDTILPNNPMAAINRITEQDRVAREAEQNKSQLYQPDQANNLYGDYGLTFNKPVRKAEADLLAKRKSMERTNQQLLSEGEDTFSAGLTSFAGSMVGSMMDPIGLAATIIPYTKILPGLKALSLSESILARTGASFIDGAIGNGLIEAIPIVAGKKDQADYGMSESLSNIFMGAALGTGIHVIGEGIRFMAPNTKYNAHGVGLKEVTNGEVPTMMRDIQEGSPLISSLAKKDLINLPDEKLIVTTEGAHTIVKLNDNNLLGEVTGRGGDIIEAKKDLQTKLGIILKDENIYNGYDRANVSEQVEQHIVDRFPGLDTQEVRLIAEAFQSANPDKLNHIFTATNGLKEMDTFLNEVEGHLSNLRQDTIYIDSKGNEKILPHKDRAEVIHIDSKGKEQLIHLKDKTTPDLMSINKEQKKVTFKLSELEEDLRIKKQQLDETYIIPKSDKLPGDASIISKLRETKNKQLDKANKNIDRAKLKAEIERLNALINATKDKVSDLNSKSDALYTSIEKASSENALRAELKKVLNETKTKLPSRQELLKKVHASEIERVKNQKIMQDFLKKEISELEKDIAAARAEIEASGFKTTPENFKLDKEVKKLEAQKLDFEGQLKDITQKIDAESQASVYSKLINSLDTETRGIPEMRDLTAKKAANKERLFSDPQALRNKIETMKTAKEKEVADLQAEAAAYLKDIATYVNKLEPAVRDQLGFTDKNINKELRLIEKDVEDLANFRKDYLDFVECRLTEA